MVTDGSGRKREQRNEPVRSHPMKKHAVRALLMLLVVAGSSAAQGLSTKWEELTGPDFLQASKGTCALPSASSRSTAR